MAIMSMHHREVARAKALCTRAAASCRAARNTRATILLQVQQNATRRMARLARGASDPDADGSVAGPLVETCERRCPHCRAETLKLLGKFHVASGEIKSERQCLDCGKRFVYARRALL
jgi:hypothetical protein